MVIHRKVNKTTLGVTQLLLAFFIKLLYALSQKDFGKIRNTKLNFRYTLFFG